MRPRVRGLFAFVVIAIATMAVVSYLLQKRVAIYTLLHGSADSPLRALAADLSGGKIDLFAFGCGVERWAVRTLSDDDAARAVADDPKEATIKRLLMLPPPPWGRDAPRFPEQVQHVVEGAIRHTSLNPMVTST